MKKYPYWEKYNLRVEKFENGISYDGDPSYPNGHLLATLIGHQPIRKNSQTITFCQEIIEIENLVESKITKHRYPLIDECGQICIYSEKSFLYDTLQNGSVIGKMDSLNSFEDEEDETSIMEIPTKDIIGLLKDTIEYQKINKWNFSFSGRIVNSNIEAIQELLVSKTNLKSQKRYRIVGEQIRSNSDEYELFIDSFNNKRNINGTEVDDYDVMFEFKCENIRALEITKKFSKLFKQNGFETDFVIFYEYLNKIVIDDIRI